MTDVPFDTLYPTGPKTEFLSVTSDVALTALSAGNRVVCGPVTAKKSIRIPDEASLDAGALANTISNGDVTNALFAWSADWGKLFAKVNPGGGISVGYISPGTYSYTDKTSLATAAHFDRISPADNNGQTVIGGQVCFVDTNLFVATYTAGSGNTIKLYAQAHQYDATAGVWRYSTPVVTGFVYSFPTYNVGKWKVKAISTTQVVVIADNNWGGQVLSDIIEQHSMAGLQGTVFDVAAGTSPSNPTITAKTSSIITSARLYSDNQGAQDTTFTFLAGGMITKGASSQGLDFAVLSSTVIAVAHTDFSTVNPGASIPADTGTNWSSGVILLSLNTSTGAMAVSSTYKWVNGPDRVVGSIGCAKIPSATKAVIAGARKDQSYKTQACVFTGSSLGTTIDVASYTGSSLVYDGVSVICPDAATAIITYRNATLSPDAATAQLCLKSVSISTDTLTANGTEIVLLGGAAINTVNPTVFDTSSFGIGYRYADYDIKSAGVIGSSLETYSFSGTTTSLRSKMSPGPYIRPYGAWEFVMPQDMGSSPKSLAFWNQPITGTGVDLFLFQEDTSAGKITQRSDGSVYGGYSRN